MKIGGTPITSIKIGSTDITEVIKDGVTYWTSVLDAPTGLALTVISDTEIQLNWTAGGITHDGHSIERSTDGVTYAEIATVTGATVTYNNTGLTAATLYYYKVRAYKGLVYSDYSAVDSDSTTGSPFEADINAKYSERSGMTLVDSKGGASLPILTPVLYKGGNTEYAYIADNGALDIGSGDYTLAGWMKPGPVAATKYLLGKLVQATTLSGSFGIFANSVTNVMASLVTSGGTFTAVHAGNFWTRDWQFYLMEVDNTNKKLRLFVDNVQSGTDTTFTGTPASLANEYEFYIGAGNATAGAGTYIPSNGYHSDCYVYKRILTPTEKTTLYNRGIVTGANAHWDCVLRKDNEILDLSGNNYHLTGVNLTVLNYKKYDAYGSRQGLTLGYARYFGFPKENHYAYKDDGTELTGITAGDGYVKDANYSGDSILHNGYDSLIGMQSAIWDRSNATNCDYLARVIDTNRYYLSTNATTKKYWHINELRNIDIWNSFMVGYKGLNFSKFTGGKLMELVQYTTEKTGADYDTAIAYFDSSMVKVVYEYCDWIASNGDRVLAFNETTKVLSLSLDKGVTFPYTKNLTGVILYCDYAHIFNNGDIMWSYDKKCYYSLNNLSTYAESSLIGADGGAFVAGAGQVLFRPIAYTDINISGVDMCVFGAYMTGTSQYTNLNIWYSIDGGQTVKSFYKFDYSTPAASARHVHSVSFNPLDNSIWVDTGDFSANDATNGNTPYNQCNWMKFTYTVGTDTWAGTVLQAGDYEWKTAGFVFSGDWIYWVSDSAGSTRRGIWRAPTSDPTNTTKHQKVFNYPNTMVHILMDYATDKVIAGGLATGSKTIMVSKNLRDFRLIYLTGGAAVTAGMIPFIGTFRNPNTDGYIIAEQATGTEVLLDFQKGEKVKIKVL